MGIESFTNPPDQPEERKGESDVKMVIGAKKNPDGTMDYSKAMNVIEINGKTPEEIDGESSAISAEKAEKEERERMERRKEFLKIPDGVKPGSTDMVYYNLRNAEFVGREALDKDKAQGKLVDDRRLGSVRDLSLESAMLEDESFLSDILVERGDDWAISKQKLKELENKWVSEKDNEKKQRFYGEWYHAAESYNSKYSSQVGNQKRNELLHQMSAVDMSDHIQQQYINLFQQAKEKGLRTMSLGNKEYPVDELIKIAERLQDRLIAAAGRSEQDK